MKAMSERKFYGVSVRVEDLMAFLAKSGLLSRLPSPGEGARMGPGTFALPADARVVRAAVEAGVGSIGGGELRVLLESDSLGDECLFPGFARYWPLLPGAAGSPPEPQQKAG